jgi:hypothetical protein
LVIKIGLIGFVFGILCSCASTSVYDNFQNDPTYSRQLIGTWRSESQKNGNYGILVLNENGTGSETVFNKEGGIILTLSYQYKATVQQLVINNLTQKVAVSLYYNMIDNDSFSLTNNLNTPIIYRRTGSAPGNNMNTTTGVEGALARAAQETLKNVPQRSKIAIVYITAQDRSTTEYVAGELEYIWVNAGYTIIDRSQLDRIRREQNFQMSGEVDDNTAVSIGKIIGANIIVTGRVDGEGNLRRLRLRALDTQTAQVVGVSSEKL